MAAFYLYNDSGADIELSEVGVFIAAGENYGFEHNDIDDVFRPGGDLESEINSGNILLTTDSNTPPASQYTAAEALEILTLQGYAREIVFDPSGLTHITSSDVQSALEDVDSAISSTGSDDNTLDEAYDEGGDGAGRTITVDAGPVQLDASSDNYSPIELTNLSSAPSTGLAAGQVVIVDNILYTYDGTRSKWLSPSKLIGFGRAGASDGVFLLGPGDLGTQNSGWTMPRDGTILAAAGSSSGGNDSKTFALGINGTLVITQSFTAGSILFPNINIDFSAGDNMQIYVTAGGAAINDPQITIEVAWRI
jgi:hypothetical protein